MKKEKKLIVDTKKALLIYEMKTRNKITQSELGRLTDVNYNSIHNWSKKAPETIKYIYNLLKITGCKFEDIVTEVEINNN